MLPLNTDVPYLEPLLFHLKNDPDLKKEFTEKSFFMPHHDLVSAAEEAMKKDCPAPRSIWILPGDSTVLTTTIGCPPKAQTNFTILIFVQCIRKAFDLSAGDDPTKVVLNGQAMELYMLRKLVKKSVHKFAIATMKKNVSDYQDVAWVRDQTLYPTEEKFLATAVEFTVKVFQ